MSPPPDRIDAGVVRAGPNDTDAVVRTLVAAHLDYVWERWAIPDHARRAAALERLYRGDIEHIGLPHGEIWRTSDSDSVAVWLPPDIDTRVTTATAEHLDQLRRDVLGDRYDDVIAATTAVAELHPPGDHWHLATMGTVPARRGRGRGTAVLRPVLGRLDAAGATAVLETSDPRNVGFYERAGFLVTARLDPPGGAPHTWVMGRPAVTTRSR